MGKRRIRQPNTEKQGDFKQTSEWDGEHNCYVPTYWTYCSKCDASVHIDVRSCGKTGGRMASEYISRDSNSWAGRSVRCAPATKTSAPSASSTRPRHHLNHTP